MSLAEFSASFRALWDSRPTIVVLCIVGFLVFVLLVFDVWLLKRRRRRPKHWRA